MRQQNTMSCKATKLYGGPQAWTAEAMRGRADWITWLDARDVDELETAVTSTQHVPLVELTQQDIQLPTLGAKLQTLQREVILGRGFTLLR